MFAKWNKRVGKFSIEKLRNGYPYLSFCKEIRKTLMTCVRVILGLKKIVLTLQSVYYVLKCVENITCAGALSQYNMKLQGENIQGIFEKYCYKVHGLSKTKWIINICYFIYEKGRYGHSKKSLTNYVLHVYKKQENRSISCNDSCTKCKNIRFPMLFKRKTNYTDLSLKYFLWNFSGYWRCVVSANLCGIYDQSVQIKIFFS